MTLPAALYARTPDPTLPIAAQGWTLADEHIFQDAGYSGLVFERPGPPALLEVLP